MDFHTDIPDIPSPPSDFLNLSYILQAEAKFDDVHLDCHKRHEGPHRRSYSFKGCPEDGVTSCQLPDGKHIPPPKYTKDANDDPPKYKQQSNSTETKNGKLNEKLGTEKGESKWTQEPFVEDPNAPKDSGYFVLIVIGLFGLVHYLPFSFLGSATEYWLYKLRDPGSNSTDPNDRNWLQANYSTIHSITTFAPGFICNLLAAVAGHKLTAQTRLFAVLAIDSAVLVLNAILTQIDTDSWQMGFFILALGSQTFMACCQALGGSGSMGLIAKLPPRYMNAQLMGQGAANVFTAVLKLISILVTPSIVDATLMYFTTGSVLMLAMMVLFYMASKTEYFRYYTNKKSSKEEKKQKLRGMEDFKLILKLTWPIMLINLFPMFFSFESVINNVAAENAKDETVWAKSYFLVICTNLIPAITGLIGRGLFNILNPDCSLITLGVATFLHHITFGFLIFFCNAYPRSHTSPIFKHDWEYGLIMATRSFLSDFLSNLTTIKSMK